MSERRFLHGYREATSDEAGLVQENDGTVWVVHPDGTRDEVNGGGGGSFTNPLTEVLVQAPTDIDASTLSDIEIPEGYAASSPTGYTITVTDVATGEIVFSADTIGSVSSHHPTGAPGFPGFYLTDGNNTRLVDITTENGLVIHSDSGKISLLDDDGVPVVFDAAVGSGTPTISFFGAAGQTQKAAPATLENLIAALTAYGLFHA